MVDASWVEAEVLKAVPNAVVEVIVSILNLERGNVATAVAFSPNDISFNLAVV